MDELLTSASPAQMRVVIPDWTTVERVDKNERASDIVSLSVSLKSYHIQRVNKPSPVFAIFS